MIINRSIYLKKDQYKHSNSNSQDGGQGRLYKNFLLDILLVILELII